MCVNVLIFPHYHTENLIPPLDGPTTIYYCDRSRRLIGELEKTVKTIYAIREMCGDLCNTTKQIKPGHFIGTVTAKVG